MESIEKEFVSFCIQSGRNYGLDSISSKLFGIIFLEINEISLYELSKKTGYSLASVSNKMRFLQGFGFVQRIKKPGSKKVFYYMEKDVVKLTLMHFEKIQTAEITPAKELMPKLIEKFEKKNLNKDETKKYQIIKDYYNNMVKIDDLMQKFTTGLKKIK